MITETNLTPVEFFQLICLELLTVGPTFRHVNHRAIVNLWSDARAKALASLVPIHHTTTGLGGDLRSKLSAISTPEEIVEHCLALSRKVGINRTLPDGQFYLPPPLLSDFIPSPDSPLIIPRPLVRAASAAD